MSGLTYAHPGVDYRKDDWNYQGWRISTYGYRESGFDYSRAGYNYNGINLNHPEYREPGWDYNEATKTYQGTFTETASSTTISCTATISSSADVTVPINPSGLNSTFVFTTVGTWAKRYPGGPVANWPNTNIAVTSLLDYLDPEQMIHKPEPHVTIAVTYVDNVAIVATMAP